MAEASPLARFLDADVTRSLRSTPSALIALGVLALLAGSALFAPWIARINPYDLAALDLLDSHTPPAWMMRGEARFILGTDSQGADLLSLILYGMRTSLLVGVLAVLMSVSIGTSLGLCAGYLGGRIDAVIMRAADVQFTFPAILLALLIGGIGQSLLAQESRAQYALTIVVVALGLSHWPHFARLVRGAVLVEKTKDYVSAARLVGRGSIWIMTRHILPNSLNPILVLATLDIAFAIMGEATLSFLGFGLPPTEPSLGTLIRTGYAYLFSGEWWVVIFPALTLVILALGVNVFGDWLRDALNPKLR